jgi:hypothetical protein
MLSFYPPLVVGEPLTLKHLIEEVRLLLDDPRRLERDELDHLWRLGYEQAIEDVIDLLSKKE